MRKRLLSLLVLLMVAVTGAWAKTYTTFQLGDVIKLGDQFAPTVDWQIRIEGAGGAWLNFGNTYTLKRAKVDGTVNVDENGNKYAFVNENDASDILVLFDVTETSDGAEVKAVSDTPSFTVGVHEVTIDTGDAFDLKVGINDHGTVKFYVGQNEVTTAQEGQTVTVEITPATGWVVNQPSGQWYAAIAAAPQRRTSDIDLLKDVTLTPVAGKDNQWTFTMARANVEISATYKKLLTHTDISTADIAAVTYTGQALTPTVTVKDGETALVLNTDYTVAYSNNTNACEATATENAPTVTITGIGEKYAGEITRTFTISKAEITQMTAPTVSELTYNGEEQVLVNAGSVEGGTVNYSLDGQTYAADVPTAKDAGPYIVYYKVVPDDNHFTNLAAQFVLQTIYKAALTAVTVASDKLVYNKQEQTPEVTSVKAGEFTVSADDYTVSGTGLNIGTYMMTVTAKSTAKNFTGTTSIQFNIVAKTVGLTWSKTTMDANGQEQLPELTLTGIEEGDACTATVTGAAIPVGTHTAKVTALSNENYALPTDSLCTFVIVRDMSNLFSDSYEWTTYVAQEDLATPAGLEAYVVSKVTTTTIETQPVGYIPVGTGVLLKRSDKTANAYKGYAYEGTPANIASLLKGSATEATKLGDYKDFLLFRDEFVMSSTNSIPAGRAYLPAAEVPANAAPALVIAFGDVTGLKAIENGELRMENWYDLNGRKLQNVPTKKGVYIKNGKKVIIK